LDFLDSVFFWKKLALGFRRLAKAWISPFYIPHFGVKLVIRETDDKSSVNCMYTNVATMMSSESQQLTQTITSIIFETQDNFYYGLTSDSSCCFAVHRI